MTLATVRIAERFPSASTPQKSERGIEFYDQNGHYGLLVRHDAPFIFRAIQARENNRARKQKLTVAEHTFRDTFTPEFDARRLRFAGYIASLRDGNLIERSLMDMERKTDPIAGELDGTFQKIEGLRGDMRHVAGLLIPRLPHDVQDKAAHFHPSAPMSLWRSAEAIDYLIANRPVGTADTEAEGNQ